MKPIKVPTIAWCGICGIASAAVYECYRMRNENKKLQYKCYEHEWDSKYYKNRCIELLTQNNKLYEKYCKWYETCGNVSNEEQG